MFNIFYRFNTNYIFIFYTQLLTTFRHLLHTINFLLNQPPNALLCSSWFIQYNNNGLISNIQRIPMCLNISYLPIPPWTCCYDLETFCSYEFIDWSECLYIYYCIMQQMSTLRAFWWLQDPIGSIISSYDNAVCTWLYPANWVWASSEVQILEKQ